MPTPCIVSRDLARHLDQLDREHLIDRWRDRVLTAREAGEAVVDHLHRARKHGPRSNAYLWYGLPQEQAVRERMDRKRERVRKIEEGLHMDFGTFLFNLGADMARIRGAA